MKRWLSHLVISLYLGALSWGILAHAVDFTKYSHPAMYYVVWDMFCGWSGYAGRIQIIGEGESGKYYEMAPGPWGEIKVFGDIGRRHYDYLGVRGAKFAHNTLKHTKHEPITRIIVIEKCWAKKYNLPDHLWNKHFDEPKDQFNYYHVMHVFKTSGELLETKGSWVTRQLALSVTNNPRLLRDTRKGTPLYAFGYRDHPRGTFSPGTIFDPSSNGQEGSRLGGR